MRPLPQTTLESAHDMRLVAEACPPAVVVNDGRTVAGRASGDLVNDGALVEAGGLERP